MASFIIPERPIPIIGQTTTVDISPGTKYGHKSDGAVITTTMIVENPEPNDLSVPFSLLTADPEEKRLDLSVEFFVLLPEYESLFSEGERAEAKRRLAAYGFQSGHPPAH